jgi:UPF0271 protein
MPRIDINCDMGESTTLWRYDLSKDLSLLQYISSMNLACGFHAGDAHTMHELVQAAMAAGVHIGAHPGFPDRADFGRTNMDLTPGQVYDIIIYQVGALTAFVKVQGGRLHHVKPHGALYNMAAKDPVIAAAICKAVYDLDKNLLLYGLSGSMLTAEAQRIGLRSYNEVFADRTYQDDGSLTSRKDPNAMHEGVDNVTDHVLNIVLHKVVVAVSGKKIPIVADTICIHGDGPHALAFARQINSMLSTQNYY